MQSVPKPSQEKLNNGVKRSHDEKPVAPAGKGKKAGSVVGHYARLVTLATSKGKLTPDEIRAECDKRGLTKKTAGNYVCYLKRAGLVGQTTKAVAV